MNHLIECLPRPDRARLLARCKSVPLNPTDVLCDAGEPTRHVWFPAEGFVSLLTSTGDSLAVQVGWAGTEGIVGAHLVLGVAGVPLRAVVQGAGSAQRLGAAAFRSELAASPALRRIVNVYLGVLLSQLAVSAACLYFHRVGPRLACCLLRHHDHAKAERFHVTQQTLAGLLGVRRVGITNAATDLQRRGLIEYRRGQVTVLDRSGLEAAACVCYAAGQPRGGRPTARRVTAPPPAGR